ncbi:MAG: hypothetical protein ABFR89_07540 [Actinomycetota bacterium]
MRRGMFLIVATLAVLAASCATETETASTSASTSPVTVSPEGSAPATTLPVTTEVADEPPAIDGDPAPDFTLALDGGGEFTLSGEQKPVYMIFWAEW